MYWSGAYWGRVYWAPDYWGTGTVECDGPYVVTGYWVYGYAQCDVLEMTASLGGGGIERRLDWGGYRKRVRGDRRFTETESEEWLAQVEAWDARRRAEIDADQARSKPTVEALPATHPAARSAVLTEPQLRQAVVEKKDEDKRKAMLALLLILNEA